MGGDPRLALLLVAERDKIRQDFFHPITEHRKSLKNVMTKMREKNHSVASQIRESLRLSSLSDYKF